MGSVRLSVGSVEVTSQVVSFRRRLHSGEVLGEHPLDLPQHRLVTEGVWWTMPPDLLVAAGVAEAAIPGAAHAAEHAAIGLLPWSPPPTDGTSAGCRPRCIGHRAADDPRV